MTATPVVKSIMYPERFEDFASTSVPVRTVVDHLIWSQTWTSLLKNSSSSS